MNIEWLIHVLHYHMYDYELNSSFPPVSMAAVKEIRIFIRNIESLFGGDFA